MEPAPLCPPPPPLAMALHPDQGAGQCRKLGAAGGAGIRPTAGQREEELLFGRRPAAWLELPVTAPSAAPQMQTFAWRHWVTHGLGNGSEGALAPPGGLRNGIRLLRRQCLRLSHTPLVTQHLPESEQRPSSLQPCPSTQTVFWLRPESQSRVPNKAPRGSCEAPQLRILGRH